MQARVPLTDGDFVILQSYLRPLSLIKRQHLLMSGAPSTH